MAKWNHDKLREAATDLMDASEREEIEMEPVDADTLIDAAIDLIEADKTESKSLLSHALTSAFDAAVHELVVEDEPEDAAKIMEAIINALEAVGLSAPSTEAHEILMEQATARYLNNPAIEMTQEGCIALTQKHIKLIESTYPDIEDMPPTVQNFYRINLAALELLKEGAGKCIFDEAGNIRYVSLRRAM